MDEHSQGEEMALQVEMGTREDLNELKETPEIDYPMKGEVKEDDGMPHTMPEGGVTFVDENGQES